MTTEPETMVTVEVLLADCLGPNLNGDAYTPEALATVAQQLRTLLAARGPLPAHLNFMDKQVGQVDACQWQPETGQLRATAQLDLAAVQRALPNLTEPPALALAVHTRYTQCSHCGKPLYSITDAPCPGGHHVIGAGAVQAVTAVGVVERSAFDRPPETATVEVAVQNQPADWPYPEVHTDDED